MTLEEFAILVGKKGIPAVRDALFALVRAWRPCHHVRLCVWPDIAHWSAWVEYDNECNLNGYAAVEGVRGSGKDADMAIRDCAVRWFDYIRKTDDRRTAAVDDACAELARGYG